MFIFTFNHLCGFLSHNPFLRKYKTNLLRILHVVKHFSIFVHMDLITQLKKQSDIIRNKSAFYGEIEIKPMTVGQLIAISPHLAQIQIEGEIKTPEDFHEKVVPQLTNFTEPLRDVFAELFECEFDDLLPIDVFNLLGIVMSQMGTEDFIKVITSVGILSRNNQEDLMALQSELKSSTK